jgi:RNA recognition motif-containing protein
MLQGTASADCALAAVFVCFRYGPLNRVEIKRNYAFVEFKNLDDAIDAQKRSHGTVFDGRTITVEFVESSRLGKDRCARVELCRVHVSCAGYLRSSHWAC